MTTDHRPRRTRVERIDSLVPDAALIAEAAGVLRSGGLVAFPTETVYGLGANALDEQAVLGIFAAKERDRSDPLIVHIAAMEDVETVAAAFPPLARSLAEAFWPGPLTLVLPRARAVAPSVSAGLSTVAVRLPNHAVALALIRAAGVPIAAPSANRFMRTSATTAQHVLDDLDGRIDMVLDGGPTEAGIESTVVACQEAQIRLLRRGAITLEALRAAVRERAEIEEPSAASGQGSPGTMERHYAPRTPLTLVTGGSEALRPLLAAAVAHGERPGVLAVTEVAATLGPGTVVEDLGSQEDSAEVARRLFAALRKLDRSGATSLFACTVPPAGRGAAVNDRLRRAATRIV